MTARTIAAIAAAVVERTAHLVHAGQAVPAAMNAVADDLYPSPMSRTDEQIEVWTVLGEVFDARGFAPMDGKSTAHRLDELGRDRAVAVLVEVRDVLEAAAGIQQIAEESR